MMDAPTLSRLHAESSVSHRRPEIAAFIASGYVGEVDHAIAISRRCAPRFSGRILATWN
jgi:hypothetical protein